MNESHSTQIVSPATVHSPFGDSASQPPVQRGRTHGLPFIFWLLEQRAGVLLMIPAVIAAVATFLARGPWWLFPVIYLSVPLVGIFAPLMYLIYRSRRHDGGPSERSAMLAWRDADLAKRWQGKKVPMSVAYEAYVSEKLDFKPGLSEAILHRNQLFRFCFTWHDISFYFREFLRQNLRHSVRSDRDDIAPVYDRGNDFYNWFLGESMVYTCGIFRNTEETLEQAQQRKLETICQYLQMRPGDRHLDIGCGWGSLLVHAAKTHGTHSTGITLAQEQAAWANTLAKSANVSDRVRVIVDDYRNLAHDKYDKITCVEMAEHVGIKNFQQFLLQVRGLLKDDGVFYLQIAGLRRSWQFEDLVWGLFMAKYVFPGADASCPLGFVVSQAERAGFEVHRVENTGTHYAVTIEKWLENWRRNEDAIVAKYGQRWFRLWSMFLAWSAQIGGQGSSALFMITLTKNIKNDKSTVGPEEAQNVAFSRRDRWIGPNPIATQQ